jgi:uncharacterized protein YjiS (DUF1127 family)
MPRRLTLDRPAASREASNASPLRRLWRHFLAVTLDRQALERLSPHELRDIGLPDRDRRDRFRDLL